MFTTPVPVPSNIIIFQYNPESMTRRFTQPGADLSGTSRDALLNAGGTRTVLQTPIESYSLAVELDAADQLEQGDVVTRLVGLHPALAALELLLYPGSRVTASNQALINAGGMMIVPPQLPIVLFVWGAMRVVPVQVNHRDGFRSNPQSNSSKG